jgi:peptidoglycan/LPS O-acetylase OafA/YrhL
MQGITPQHRELPADVLQGPPPPPRLSWLDPARGVAILFVLLYHTFGYLNRSSAFHGEAGVDAFLLLSGFGLAYSTRAEPWVAFAWRRLKRLLPAYWIVLGLCLLDFWNHGVVFGWKQVLLHVLSLHLIAGDEYAFTMCMSFWFIGLIVPLYVWFALLRPWLLSGRGYAALALSLALATFLGVMLLRHFPQWGSSSLGHAPHRLPQFFLGALVGLAYVRREPPDRLVCRPFLLLGLIAFAATIAYFDWVFVPFVIIAGAGIVGLGMLAAIAGERWRIAGPLSAALAVVGMLAYELYLCHQYLLLSVLPRDLMPRLTSWFPRLPRSQREILLAIVALGLSLWIAWALRWIVAFRDNRRSWRTMVPTLAALTVAVAITTAVIARPQRPPRARTFELAITLPATDVHPCVEPVITFGSRPDESDAVALEHDGHGLARFRIDHAESAPVVSDWLPAIELIAGKINVVITADHLEVRSSATTLRSPLPPHAPGAYGAVGVNNSKMPGIEASARSKVVRTADVVRSRT